MNVCKPLPKTLTNCWEWYKTAQDQLTEFVQQTVTQMFADDPSLLLPPGVTDGSVAAPGMIGEIWTTTTATGNWNSGAVTPPAINFIISTTPLPAGDWDLSWKLIVNPVNNGPQAAACWLSSPPAGALNDMLAYSPNIPGNLSPYPPADGGPQPFVLVGPTIPINIAMAVGLVWNFCVWTPLGSSTGTYSFTAFARRVR